MKKIKTLIPLCFLFFMSLFAQEDVSLILEETNVTALNDLSKQWSTEMKIAKEEAIIEAQLRGWPITIKTDNQYLELQRLDERGLPLYYTTTNVNAARTTRADRLNTGGSTGLNLDGNTMKIAEWDGGATLATHEQFGGRVTQVDSGGGLYSDHATHVAGTMIGDGVGVGPNAADAKGMAPMATLDAYDWNTDLAEMATAAANGILVSNHSYGFENGWYYIGSATADWGWAGSAAQFTNTGEDPGFGKYSVFSRNWDKVAVNAPYYLIFKAAGNDRIANPWIGSFVSGGGAGAVPYDPAIHPAGDGVFNGGFDILSDAAVAKNVMVIGAVDDVLNYTGPSSVAMSSFSSWGPTDDGRIKPDITANGVNLWSSLSTGNADYASYGGTSMASPNACGTAILLQEHYQNTHGGGVFMKSATLRGLLIHTADEAGNNPGPDYRYGWGLMNAEAAAAVITEDVTVLDVITESTLANGGTFTLNINSDGLQPLYATIAWLDPAGTVNSNTIIDDPTPVLVNDLDLRLSNGTTFMPYKLNPATPTAAATTGDNVVDNVEKIYLGTPAAGSYTLTINHKGTLSSGSQDFCLIISGAAFDCINVVTNTNDSGYGSLRGAINCVNADPAMDLITFNIPGAGPHIINPLIALPYVSDANVVIDGTTQLGWTVGNIVLDGTGLTNTWGIGADADGFEMYGIKIQNFDKGSIGFISNNVVLGKGSCIK